MMKRALGVALSGLVSCLLLLTGCTGGEAGSADAGVERGPIHSIHILPVD
jgi:hypothetical protein